MTQTNCCERCTRTVQNLDLKTRSFCGYALCRCHQTEPAQMANYDDSSKRIGGKIHSGIPTQTSGTETKWEEEFDAEYKKLTYMGYGGCQECGIGKKDYDIKPFIRTLLTKAREGMIKEIQNEIFPQGLDDPEIDMSSYAWIVHIFQALNKPQ